MGRRQQNRGDFGAMVTIIHIYHTTGSYDDERKSQRCITMDGLHEHRSFGMTELPWELD
jgi:hypothetical protein